MQGRNMTDKCAPHPWVKAHNRPLKGGKIKRILLLSILCNFFAPRETPDLNTKQTRNTSVICSPKEEQTEKEKKTKTIITTLYFSIQIKEIHIPMHHPRGMGPPLLRCVNGGLQ
jgi:hypothetical protein